MNSPQFRFTCALASAALLGLGVPLALAGTQEDVNLELLKRLDKGDHLRAIYERHKNTPPPEGVEVTEASLKGQLSNQGMQFKLPSAVPLSPLLLQQFAVSNCNEFNQTQTISVSKTTTDSNSWGNSHTLTTSVEAKFDVKIPLVGGTEVTAGLQHEAGWTKSTEHSETVGWDQSQETVIGPQRRVVVLFVVSEEKMDVPYWVDFVAAGPVELNYTTPATSEDPGLRWAAGRNGSLPAGAVKGGREPGRDLYVCRARHQGGLHPGKVVARNCNISWGGKEIEKNAYEVLLGDSAKVSWINASNGRVPSGGFIAGRERGRNLYLCRAGHRGGTHPGKVHLKWCHFGWGGKEILKKNYQVLVPGKSRPAKSDKITVNLEDYLSLEERTFRIRGAYKGVTGVQGEFRVGPPTALENCGSLVSRGARSPRAFTFDAASTETSAQSQSAGAEKAGKGIFLETFSSQEIAEAALLPASAKIGETMIRLGLAQRRFAETGARTLRLQDPYQRGDDVQAVQEAITAAGFTVAIDGIYGPLSAAGVKAYQESRGLPVTGQVDAATLKNLGI